MWRAQCVRIVIYSSSQSIMMGASCFGAAFAWAPNFREGLNAAGRIIISLTKQSTIVDPDIPVVDNFVSIILITTYRYRFAY